MNKSYERPVVIIDPQLSEGVYLASGGAGNCYSASAYITQKPETGRESYCIHADAVHNATHHSTAQRLTLSFNIPVTFISCNDAHANCTTQGAVSTLVIEYNYHANFTENHGLGDIYVSAGDGLAITGCVMEDIGMHDTHDGCQ